MLVYPAHSVTPSFYPYTVYRVPVSYSVSEIAVEVALTDF
jgi:hypothetical protein